MNRLRQTSSKHLAQRVLTLASLVILMAGLLPFGVAKRLALLWLFVMGGVFLVMCLKLRRKPLEALLFIWMIHQVEVELLRSDFVWREVSSDLEKGRSLVELPSVRILESSEVLRVIAVANSMKYQERLLKADMSSVFNGWIMADVELNEDKSEVIFTLTKQDGDLAYRFDSLKEVKDFARVQEAGRIPMDKLTSMKQGHMLLVGQTGGGKSYALVYLLMYYLSLGWCVVIADPKNSDLALLGRSFNLRVETEPEEIVNLVAETYQQMEQRKHELEGHQKFGQTAQQQGYTPIMLIVDEFASLSLKLDKKQLAELTSRLGSVVLEGRQLSVNVTLCMQQANAQVVPTSIREQLVTKLVMGASDDQTYITAFGQSSASEVLSMRMKPGQGWLMTEGVVKPRFVRLPWLSGKFMQDVDRRVARTQGNASDESAGLLIAKSRDGALFMP